MGKKKKKKNQVQIAYPEQSIHSPSVPSFDSSVYLYIYSMALSHFIQVIVFF